MKSNLRFLSAFVLANFLFQQISFAAEIKPETFNLFPKPQIHLNIPESIATLEDAYTPPSEGRTTQNPNLVYLIQDAHTNESGQINLSKTLDLLLKEEKDLEYIFVEAGSGDDSLSVLRKYTTLAERKTVADEYLRKGILHGEEYLDLTSDHEFMIWGVENMALYQKTLDAYKYVAKDRERFQSYLKKIEQATNTLKPRLFNPSLLSFDEKYQKFLKEEISPTDYFQILTQEAKKQNISLEEYPHLKSLKALKDREEQINFKKANEEQQTAIQSLSQEDQKELLEYAKTDSPFKLGSNEHKEQKAFYTLLQEKLANANSKYPELHKYFDYLKQAKSLNPKAVLYEQKTLEMELFSTLSKTQDEKTLLNCDKSLKYFQKLFNLTLTPEEFQDYKSQDFGIVHLTGFLNKKIMDLKNYYERASFLKEGFDEMVKNAETFYTLTKDRDEVFLKNMSQKMVEEGQTKAVLITGGFHTPNLKSLLKRQSVSFISITPQVLHETNQKRYESILLNQKINPNILNQSSMQHMDRTLMLRDGAELPSFVSGFSTLPQFVGARLAAKQAQLEKPYVSPSSQAVISRAIPLTTPYRGRAIRLTEVNGTEYLRSFMKSDVIYSLPIVDVDYGFEQQSNDLRVREITVVRLHDGKLEWPANDETKKGWRSYPFGEVQEHDSQAWRGGSSVYMVNPDGQVRLACHAHLSLANISQAISIERQYAGAVYENGKIRVWGARLAESNPSTRRTLLAGLVTGAVGKALLAQEDRRGPMLQPLMFKKKVIEPRKLTVEFDASKLKTQEERRLEDWDWISFRLIGGNLKELEGSNVKVTTTFPYHPQARLGPIVQNVKLEKGVFHIAVPKQPLLRMDIGYFHIEAEFEKNLPSNVDVEALWVRNRHWQPSQGWPKKVGARLADLILEIAKTPSETTVLNVENAASQWEPVTFKWLPVEKATFRMAGKEIDAFDEGFGVLVADNAPFKDLPVLIFPHPAGIKTAIPLIDRPLTMEEKVRVVAVYQDALIKMHLLQPFDLLGSGLAIVPYNGTYDSEKSIVKLNIPEEGITISPAAARLSMTRRDLLLGGSAALSALPASAASGETLVDWKGRDLLFRASPSEKDLTDLDASLIWQSGMDFKPPLDLSNKYYALISFKQPMLSDTLLRISFGRWNFPETATEYDVVKNQDSVRFNVTEPFSRLYEVAKGRSALVLSLRNPDSLRKVDAISFASSRELNIDSIRFVSLKTYNPRWLKHLPSQMQSAAQDYGNRHFDLDVPGRIDRAIENLRQGRIQQAQIALRAMELILRVEYTRKWNEDIRNPILAFRVVAAALVSIERGRVAEAITTLEKLNQAFRIEIKTEAAAKSGARLTNSKALNALRLTASSLALLTASQIPSAPVLQAQQVQVKKSGQAVTVLGFKRVQVQGRQVQIDFADAVNLRKNDRIEIGLGQKALDLAKDRPVIVEFSSTSPLTRQMRIVFPTYGIKLTKGGTLSFPTPSVQPLLSQLQYLHITITLPVNVPAGDISVEARLFRTGARLAQSVAEPPVQVRLRFVPAKELLETTPQIISKPVIVSTKVVDLGKNPNLFSFFRGIGSPNVLGSEIAHASQAPVLSITLTENQPTKFRLSLDENLLTATELEATQIVVVDERPAGAKNPSIDWTRLSQVLSNFLKGGISFKDFMSALKYADRVGKANDTLSAKSADLLTIPAPIEMLLEADKYFSSSLTQEQFEALFDEALAELQKANLDAHPDSRILISGLNSGTDRYQYAVQKLEGSKLFFLADQATKDGIVRIPAVFDTRNHEGKSISDGRLHIYIGQAETGKLTQWTQARILSQTTANLLSQFKDSKTGEIYLTDQNKKAIEEALQKGSSFFKDKLFLFGDNFQSGTFAEALFGIRINSAYFLVPRPLVGEFLSTVRAITAVLSAA